MDVSYSHHELLSVLIPGECRSDNNNNKIKNNLFLVDNVEKGGPY